MSCTRRPATLTLESPGVSDVCSTPLRLATTGGSRNVSLVLVPPDVIAAATSSNADRIMPPNAVQSRDAPAIFALETATEKATGDGEWKPRAEAPSGNGGVEKTRD